MTKEIKVNIKGTITEYNLKLFSERVALELLRRLGEENCRTLLELLIEKKNYERNNI